MTKPTFVEQFVKNPKNRRLFLQERAIREVTDQIESLMENLGISRAGLARKLGKSRGWVTQFLDGEANKTIRTVADAYAVLGYEFKPSYNPIQISNAQIRTTIVQINNVLPFDRRSDSTITTITTAATNNPLAQMVT
jgi:transcriptional regulator with XRE-family HTH domain